MMKNVLVFGACGMLGYAVSEYFKRNDYCVDSITRKEFDIAKDNIKQIESAIQNTDVVINCAGVIKSRIDITPIEDILKVNSIFPRNLAKLCNKYKKFCFHITTDCAFSGNRGKYTESDYFDAEDVYGLSKSAGESTDCMVLRTSIIGEEKETSRSLLEWVRSNKNGTIDGFTNHLWNGLTTTYLTTVITNILNLNLYRPGIFHIFSDKIVNKFELVSMINEVYNLGISINKFETSKSCDRSLSSEKDLCEKVVKKTLRKQIEEMKRFFEEIKK
ncbi:MAG: sugar nucleotide-binding protein [Proteobacteria bacterium]|nr:sugar nucleotide-binding protein [Pseudomonadota bacterium]